MINLKNILCTTWSKLNFLLLLILFSIFTYSNIQINLQLKDGEIIAMLNSTLQRNETQSYNQNSSKLSIDNEERKKFSKCDLISKKLG
jgi:hypothetical protein